MKSSRAAEFDIFSLKQRLDQQAAAIDAYYLKEARAQAEEASAIDATRLFAAFEANEVRANQEFKGRRFPYEAA